MPFRHSRAAAAAVALGCALPAVTSCAASGTVQAGSSPVAPASSAAAAGATPAGAASTAATGSGGSSIDPCSLLTPAQAKAALNITLGTGRKVTTGDLSECVYSTSGLLIVAVLDSSFTQDSFKALITSQDSGPFSQTSGKSAPVSGLGDAAYTYAQAGIVEVLKGSTVISITADDVAGAEKAAQAVLPNLH
jgi:hypothetical protein